MKKLYTYEAPREYRLKLADTEQFYVPATDIGVKTSSFLDRAMRDERLELFKIAVENNTKDLSEAYKQLKDIDQQKATTEKTVETKNQPTKKDSEDPFVTELEYANEKVVDKRRRANVEKAEDDFEAENDVVIFKTWLDD